jgi:hypothetical protein
MTSAANEALKKEVRAGVDATEQFPGCAPRASEPDTVNVSENAAASRRNICYIATGFTPNCFAILRKARAIS